MTRRAGPRRRHLASSPFAPEPEPIIEIYAREDLVSHDVYGMGRVLDVESDAVTVNFRDQTVRIPSPYHRMERL